MDDDAQQQAECIDEDVALAPRDLLARIEALRVERSPPFCAPLALWLSITAADGLASRPSRVAYRHIERVVDALERAVPVPQHEVVMCRRLRRQVLGQRRPLAARPKNIEDPVEHLADVHVARPTAAPAGSLARSAPTPHPSDRSGNASRAVRRLAGVQASTSRTPPECFGCPTMNRQTTHPIQQLAWIGSNSFRGQAVSSEYRRG